MVEGVDATGGGGTARPGPDCGGTVLDGGVGTARVICEGGPGGGAGGVIGGAEGVAGAAAFDPPALGIDGGLARLVNFAV